ncbi:MAG: hypothetical protein AABZ12_06855 [Planctomycetota bacterium]
MTPATPCLGDTITFTLGGVVDSGGRKLANCQEVTIGPGTLSYTWVITKPDGSSINGSGSVATVVADLPGTHTCYFYVSSDRVCAPPSLTIGPATALAIRAEMNSITTGVSPVPANPAIVAPMTPLLLDDGTLWWAGWTCRLFECGDAFSSAEPLSARGLERRQSMSIVVIPLFLLPWNAMIGGPATVDEAWNRCKALMPQGPSDNPEELFKELRGWSLDLVVATARYACQERAKNPHAGNDAERYASAASGLFTVLSFYAEAIDELPGGLERGDRLATVVFDLMDNRDEGVYFRRALIECAQYDPDTRIQVFLTDYAVSHATDVEGMMSKIAADSTETTDLRRSAVTTLTLAIEFRLTGTLLADRTIREENALRARAGDNLARPARLPLGGVDALEADTRKDYLAIDAAARRHVASFATVLRQPDLPAVVRQEIVRVLDSWTKLALSPETVAVIHDAQTIATAAPKE